MLTVNLTSQLVVADPKERLAKSVKPVEKSQPDQASVFGSSQRSAFHDLSRSATRSGSEESDIMHLRDEQH